MSVRDRNSAVDGHFFYFAGKRPAVLFLTVFFLPTHTLPVPHSKIHDHGGRTADDNRYPPEFDQVPAQRLAGIAGLGTALVGNISLQRAVALGLGPFAAVEYGEAVLIFHLAGHCDTEFRAVTVGDGMYISLAGHQAVDGYQTAGTYVVDGRAAGVGDSAVLL